MILQKYFYCADLVQETLLLLMLKTGVLLNIFVETMVHVFFQNYALLLSWIESWKKSTFFKYFFLVT